MLKPGQNLKSFIQKSTFLGQPVALNISLKIQISRPGQNLDIFIQISFHISRLKHDLENSLKQSTFKIRAYSRNSVKGSPFLGQILMLKVPPKNPSFKAWKFTLKISRSKIAVEENRVLKKSMSQSLRKSTIQCLRHENQI